MLAQASRRVLVCGIALLALFAACGDPDETDSTAATQSIELEAYDFYFEETQLLFDLGARVEIDFVNAGENTHSFTADDLDIDVEVGSAETTEIAFRVPDEPGIFDFYCKYHPDDMSGTISVGGSDQPIEENEDDPDNDDPDVEVDVEEEQDAGGGGGPRYDY